MYYGRLSRLPVVYRYANICIFVEKITFQTFSSDFRSVVHTSLQHKLLNQTDQTLAINVDRNFSSSHCQYRHSYDTTTTNTNTTTTVAKITITPAKATTSATTTAMITLTIICTYVCMYTYVICAFTDQASRPGNTRPDSRLLLMTNVHTYIHSYITRSLIKKSNNDTATRTSPNVCMSVYTPPVGVYACVCYYGSSVHCYFLT